MFVVAVVAIVGLVAGTRSPAPATPGSPASGGRRSRRRVVRVVLHRAVDRVGRGARGARADEHDVGGVSRHRDRDVGHRGGRRRRRWRSPPAAWWCPRSPGRRLVRGCPRTVTISGGGVAVTQAVHGSSGWSESPCQSTHLGDLVLPERHHRRVGRALRLLAQSDLDSRWSSTSPSSRRPGRCTRSTTRGSCCRPAGSRSRTWRARCRTPSTVSTVVTPGRGASSRPRSSVGPVRRAASRSSPARPAAGAWTIPQGQELSGGCSELDVFNPGTTAEEVTVRLRLASGPLHPLSDAGPARHHVGAGHQRADAHPRPRRLHRRGRRERWGRRGGRPARGRARLGPCPAGSACPTPSTA